MSSSINQHGPPGAAGQPELPAAVQRIILMGFMGSGKSTVGRRLAERIGWQFVDLDRKIEQTERRTVAQIFAESGEAFFRSLESQALSAALRQVRIVVALGGGALESPANQQLLRETPQTLTVHLTASFDTLYARCEQQIATGTGHSLPVRPLLGDRAAASARLQRREPIYRHLAQIVLDTTGEEPQASVGRLLEILKNIL